MARRKQEPRAVHRENIALAAQLLFMKKGIESTTMDEIANAANYSKATLYVYFQNKEEIVSVLVLESMKKLRNYINSALEQESTIKEKYRALCYSLVNYYEEFPLYYKMALEKINIDFENELYFYDEEETYNTGEEIMGQIKQFLVIGIKEGVLREDIEVDTTIFAFWGMLSGFIQMTANKKEYIEKGIKISTTALLDNGFNMMYRSIESVGDKNK